MKGDIETYHEGDAWKNREEGQEAWISEHSSKEQAVQVGRDLARERKVEHIIKNKDGTIGERNSYGNDPRSSKG